MRMRTGMNHSYRMPCTSRVTQSGDARRAGEYSAERLNALQSSTRVLPGRPQPKEPAFKLSGSFKAAAVPSDDRFTVNAKDLVRLFASSP